ncbi:MAG: type II toxin-antitoxin system HicA family toxin [Parasphingopyxis sp.]|uniref:type II toxin-antitoxin system HicA family toxin n=1 Tax=Parasphingopyxis sp. TaxID=1920299 RepID=UPI0032EAA1BD
MNKKQARTLTAIFADPVSASIVWTDVEKLLIACGCETIEGKGSRVKFVRDGRIISFHRPHPEKEAKRYQIRDAREFLEKIGVKP